MSICKRNEQTNDQEKKVTSYLDLCKEDFSSSTSEDEYTIKVNLLNIGKLVFFYLK